MRSAGRGAMGTARRAAMLAVAMIAAAAAPAPAAGQSAPSARVAVPADQPDGPAIMALATAAHGGAAWANVRTLHLVGHAAFWGETGAEPRSRMDSYVMWRVFDPARAAAHQAEGKVRIIGRHQGRDIFTVGFDGTTTWTDRGITPAAEAAAFWANNMGFGIIRHALKPGFRAERVADGDHGGAPIWLVRLTDPGGGQTLFGIDQRDHLVRTMGFASPKGWHERHYGQYFRAGPGGSWQQPGIVTLFYNGVRANSIMWTAVTIDGPVDAALFAPPPAAR